MTEPALFGMDLFGNAVKPKPRGPVADRFTFPPFSVLDARQGEWKERKARWAAMGIRGETGRTATAYNTEKNKIVLGDAEYPTECGTSIFDPVLCELVYRWFTPPGAQVVDPFAGGSVRGIVAAELGRRYWGCDLRREQIDANEQQAADICQGDRPMWICGDSTATLANAPSADLVFSCPPYGDLERYSDDPADLSAMDWHSFIAVYRDIIAKAVAKLRRDRFACFVVGDFRDKRGLYRCFVNITIEAFRDAGAELYNEAILLTPAGSAAMRVTNQFNSGRKLCKTHQNVLLFVKGDWRKAAAYCNG